MNISVTQQRAPPSCRFSATCKPAAATYFDSLILTALHGMQTRSSDENSVRLFVRPSVERVDCDKTEEKSVQILYTIRKII